MKMLPPHSNATGFTLVEMALVLLIIGVLTRAGIAPLYEVQSARQIRQAQAQLQRIKQSVQAYVVANGVLPCPVTLRAHTLVTRNTEEAACATAQAGVTGHGGVPARLLGIEGPVDANGSLLDPWNNPYRLAVSMVNHADYGNPDLADWLHVGEASSIGLSQLQADLVLCMESVAGHCPNDKVRAHEIAYIAWTLGADDSRSGAQGENQDQDLVFVLQEPSIHAEAPFDDQLVWGARTDVIYWLLRAAWLP